MYYHWVCPLVARPRMYVNLMAWLLPPLSIYRRDRGRLDGLTAMYDPSCNPGSSVFPHGLILRPPRTVCITPTLANELIVRLLSESFGLPT